MTDRNPIDDYENIVRAFDELLEDMLMSDPDEADRILREAGYDPQQVGARLESAAKEALEKSSLNWKARARDEMEKAKTRLENFASASKRNRAEMLDAITHLISKQPSQVAAHFRNFARATEADLEGMLAELEYLDSQQNQQADRKNKD